MQRYSVCKFACRRYVTIARIIATSDNRVGDTREELAQNVRRTLYAEKYIRALAQLATGLPPGIIGRMRFLWKRSGATGYE